MSRFRGPGLAPQGAKQRGGSEGLLFRLGDDLDSSLEIRRMGIFGGMKGGKINLIFYILNSRSDNIERMQFTDKIL